MNPAIAVAISILDVCYLSHIKPRPINHSFARGAPTLAVGVIQFKYRGLHPFPPRTNIMNTSIDVVMLRPRLLLLVTVTSHQYSFSRVHALLSTLLHLLLIVHQSIVA
jgi:hypothetical protein